MGKGHWKTGELESVNARKLGNSQREPFLNRFAMEKKKAN